MSREEMDRALKTHFVPALRQRGFKGSLPHFRRLRDNQVDLITIQFDRHGGGFVVEIASWSVEGLTTHWGKFIPALKLTAHDLHPNQRYRLGSPGPSTDNWFRFDREVSPTAVAERLLQHLDEAERWWSARSS